MTHEASDLLEVRGFFRLQIILKPVDLQYNELNQQLQEQETTNDVPDKPLDKNSNRKRFDVRAIKLKKRPQSNQLLG